MVLIRAMLAPKNVLTRWVETLGAVGHYEIEPALPMPLTSVNSESPRFSAGGFSIIDYAPVTLCWQERLIVLTSIWRLSL